MGKRLSHDDFVAHLAGLTRMLAELRVDGPLVLQQARDDLEAEAMPASTCWAPGGHGGSESMSGPERYALAATDGRGSPLSVVRAEGMCAALLTARRELWHASRAAHGSRPAGVDRAKVGTRAPVGSDCIVCDEPAPRPRAGMCEADYRAWVREGRPDKMAFRARRRAATAAKPEAEAA